MTTSPPPAPEEKLLSDDELQEIRRNATQPLASFNALNDIGKAYAYGSDVNALLDHITAQAAQLQDTEQALKTAHLRIIAQGQELSRRLAQLQKYEEALES